MRASCSSFFSSNRVKSSKSLFTGIFFSPARTNSAANLKPTVYGEVGTGHAKSAMSHPALETDPERQRFTWTTLVDCPKVALLSYLVSLGSLGAGFVYTVKFIHRFSTYTDEETFFAPPPTHTSVTCVDDVLLRLDQYRSHAADSQPALGLPFLQSLHVVRRCSRSGTTPSTVSCMHVGLDAVPFFCLA